MKGYRFRTLDFVLFVGRSLDDLNVRRWPYTSFRERVEHRKKYLREINSPASSAARNGGPTPAQLHMQRPDRRDSNIEGPIFEYACHEGNYGLANILAAARAKERESKIKASVTLVWCP